MLTYIPTHLHMCSHAYSHLHTSAHVHSLHTECSHMCMSHFLLATTSPLCLLSPKTHTLTHPHPGTGGSHIPSLPLGAPTSLCPPPPLRRTPIGIFPSTSPPTHTLLTLNEPNGEKNRATVRRGSPSPQSEGKIPGGHSQRRGVSTHNQRGKLDPQN